MVCYESGSNTVEHMNAVKRKFQPQTPSLVWQIVVYCNLTSAICVLTFAIMPRRLAPLFCLLMVIVL